ncbi:hypothetical protein MW887_001326 [Aspergillus wentii]|nr:hypothetical protein MW887_001326 [Aspergillus wentii]
MPLHLLGKKSWNVYNPENVARVRRDEAQAKAQEEEQERQMQEVDAERRIQILRGERPPTPPPPPSLPSLPSSTTQPEKSHREETGRFRKRRRLAGENDTDRDIRFAREDAEFAVAKREELAVSRVDDAPLEDSAGHINLFPSKGKDRAVEKNAEAEAESADQKRKYEDQYTMRFSNAAGFKQSIGQKPWYHSSADGAMAPDSVPGKDVWGNEDPLRKQREAARMDANDPLAAMRKGVRQLKSVEQERKSHIIIVDEEEDHVLGRRLRMIAWRDSSSTDHQTATGKIKIGKGVRIEITDTIGTEVVIAHIGGFILTLIRAIIIAIAMRAGAMIPDILVGHALMQGKKNGMLSSDIT